MTHAEIERLIVESIEDLFDRDLFLLQEDVSERAITHKLAEYIQTRIPDFNIDCEYNRDVTRGRGSSKSIKLLRGRLITKRVWTAIQSVEQHAY